MSKDIDHAECKWCHRAIALCDGGSVLDPYWYHPHNQNVKCSLKPDDRNHRAAPM